MKILLFDIDGVLLKPLGYHHALKETVRLAGISLGMGEVLLTDEQIVQFEALGISSEWHSSALCLALLTLENMNQQGSNGWLSASGYLSLEDLFERLASQPMQSPALKRGLNAVERLAEIKGVPFGSVQQLLAQSESIEASPTMNWFQELVLGSVGFRERYQKAPQLQTESYLTRYDQRLLDEQSAEKIIRWADRDGNGAALMTNRPSYGLPGYIGDPDASLGAALVGLENFPLIGYGELSWLAARIDRDVSELSKPGWAHALAALLAASGTPLEDSLELAGRQPVEWNLSALMHLADSTVTVFEDTPGGIVAVDGAVRLLNELGLRVSVEKIGIAEDAAKKTALAAEGAIVYSIIGEALSNFPNF